MWGRRSRRRPWPLITSATRKFLSKIKRQAAPVCESLLSCPSYREYARVDRSSRDSGRPNTFLSEKVEVGEEVEHSPTRLLDHWLGELHTIGKGLDGGRVGGSHLLAPRPVLRPQDPEGGARQRKQEYRCSIINMDNSQDEELDAILGELTELQDEFETEIQEDRKRKNTPPSLDIEKCRCLTFSGVRVKSPDGDSAFGDNISLLSTSSSRIREGHDQQLTTETKKEAKLKNEKIKLAIEKIKEASIKKIFIKVFSSDGSATSLLIDEKMTVGQVTRILAEKNNLPLDPNWALVELVPNLFMERVYEDNELVVENCLLWKVDSKNTLWFIERPEKFDLFSRPEIYLLGTTSSQKDEQMEEHSRQELLEEYFSSSGVGAPQIEGFIWLKANHRKSWKKFYFILRTSGLYYAPKGKKTSRDLVCLTTFDMNQVFYGVGWKGKYKAPSEFCFGIKHPQIQAKNPKYIKYLCLDTQKELHEWVTGIRIAKNGRNLFDNYRGIVEEITHADIDILTSKRFSIDSIRPAERTSGLVSQVVTPCSESKSLVSALSSGIESDMSMSSKMSQDGLTIEVEAVVERSGTLQRKFSQASSFSHSSHSSFSCVSDRGFESDFPEGGTIRKRPVAHFPLTDVTWGLVKDSDLDPREEEALPPPPRSQSVTSLDSIDLLPPPSPEMCGRGLDALHQVSTLFQQTSLLNEPGVSLTHRPPRHPTLRKTNSTHKPSSRKISFDDNVQMIDAPDSATFITKYVPQPPIRNSNPQKLTWLKPEMEYTESLPSAFLDNLQKVMNKKWQVAEKCQANKEITPHKVLGFRTDEPVNVVGQPNLYSKNSAIGAWVLETQMYAHQPQFQDQEVQVQRQVAQQVDQLMQPYQLQIQQGHQVDPVYEHHQKQFLGQYFQDQLQHEHQQQQQCFEHQQYGHSGVYEQLQNHQYRDDGVYEQLQHTEQLQQNKQLQQTEQQCWDHGVFQQQQQQYEPTYVDPGRMRQNKVKRPPPPPRRSQDTQLSNHV